MKSEKVWCIRNKNWIKGYLSIPIFILMAGCGTSAELKQIQDFSTKANDVRQQLPLISSDFYPSCLRASRYQAVDVLPVSGINPSILETTSSVDIEEFAKKITRLEEKIDSDSTLESQVAQLQRLKARVNRLANNPNGSQFSEPNFLQERVNAQKRCNKTLEFSGQEEPQIPSQYLGELMESGNNVIAGYLMKMGELAGADLVKFDTQFNALKGSVNNLSKVLFTDLFNFSPSEQTIVTQRVSAGVDIANFIVNQIFGGKRIKTLRESITSGNEPLKRYSGGLQSIVERVYINNYINTEEDALDQYYIEYISAILDSAERQQGDSVVAIVELILSIENDRWNMAKEKIQERRQLALNYIQLLQTVIDGHQSLANTYKEGKDPSPEQVGKLLEESTLAMTEFSEQAKLINETEPRIALTSDAHTLQPF